RPAPHGWALGVRRHELVLAAEVLIERCLRRVGLRQDAVDPHGPHPLLVEQAIGGVEEAVTNADLGVFRPFPGFLRHALTLQTDRSIVNGMNRQNGLFSTSRRAVPLLASRVARPSGVSTWVTHFQARPHWSPAPTVASAKPSWTRSSRQGEDRGKAA